MKKLRAITLILILTVIIAISLVACSIDNYEKFSKQLKNDSQFTNGLKDTDVVFDYGFDYENYPALVAKYDLEFVAGGGNDLEKTLNILIWLNKHTYYDETKYAKVDKQDAFHLLEYAYDQDGKGIDSNQLAITMTDCIRALGIKARTVYILPKVPRDFDNRVITQVYLDSLSKWIMLDPSCGAVFQDENNNYLNCFELRNLLAENKEFKLNSEANYNGEYIKNDSFIEYKTFLSKNLYWFQSAVKIGYDDAICIPDRLNIQQWKVGQANYQYKQKKISKQQRDMFKAYIPVRFTQELFLRV